MAISDRINEMYTHVGDVYDTITNVDLPTNKNIQNIPSTMRSSYLEIMNNGIDKIWNNWEKVTGEGETLTLNSTEEAPMKINLKGNTSQETAILPSEYTQVDYIQSSGTQYIDTGYLAKGSLKVITDIEYTSTASGNQFIYGGRNSAEVNTNAVLFSSNDTKFRNDYNTKVILATPSISNLVAKWHIVKDKGSLTMTSSDNQTITQTITNATFSSSYNVYIFTCNNAGNVLNSASYRLYTFKMYDNDTLVRDYVPCYRNSDNEIGMYDLVNNVFYTNAGTGAFTYGAVVTLPNPDYPQDIHVVSGDNSIDVCGKNLCNNVFRQGNINNTTATNRIITSNDLYLKSGNYTFSTDLDLTLYKYAVVVTSEPAPTASTNIIFDSSWKTSSYTLNLETDAYVYILIANTNQWSSETLSLTIMQGKYFQIEKGTSSSTYTPYVSQNYPIYLGESDDVFKASELLQGAFNSPTNTIRVCWFGKKIKNGDIVNVEINNSDFRFACARSAKDINSVDNSIAQDSGWQTSTYTFTSNEIGYFCCVISKTNDSAITPSDISNSDLTITYGTKTTQSIKLCKIGDYQDSIKKSTGKNLFDKSTIVNNSIYTGNVGQVVSIGTNTNTFRYPIFKKTSDSITISASDTSAIMRVLLLDNDNKILSTTAYTTLPQTIDTSSCEYIAIFFDNTTITANDNIQINEGSTTLPFEPYGKVWYVNKQIGKVVLNGTQNITLASSGTRRFNATYTTLGISNVKEGTSAEDTTLHYRMNDHFIYSAGQNTWGRYYLYNNWLVMLDSGSAMADANALKTWLASNNTIIYYVLATPTYTEITDSTLLSQLEALNGAKSYTTQTNISQENNDLPFILDVTALKQLTQ